MSATLTSDPVRTADTTDTTVPTRTRGRVRSIWKAVGVYGVIAAATTTIVAAVARAAGAALAVDGEQIPLLGFAQLTLAGAVIGGVLATVLHKRARRPQRTFVITTVALTAASIVPDFTMGIATGSAVVLALTHVLAAAIVIPALGARAAR
jgi:peptidoglycan/LPS O-acetylase OafA/YrhL